MGSKQFGEDRALDFLDKHFGKLMIGIIILIILTLAAGGYVAVHFLGKVW